MALKHGLKDDCLNDKVVPSYSNLADMEDREQYFAEYDQRLRY